MTSPNQSQRPSRNTAANPRASDLCGQLTFINTSTTLTVSLPCDVDYKLGTDSTICNAVFRNQSLSAKLGKLHCVFRGQLRRGRSRMEEVFTVCVEDCSQHGTFINGERIPSGVRVDIPDGATVSFGGPPDKYLTSKFGLFRPNTIQSRFKFGRVLGDGGFGQVYEVKSRRTGLAYAVKKVRHQILEGGAAVVNSARKEFEVLKQLKHPNIVQLHAVFSDSSDIYLIMEIAMGDLGGFIGETGLTESSAQVVTLQVCSALDYLHQQNIFHRDVKPQNILVFSRNPITVKLSDFGLARAIDGATAFQSVCGTPQYIAPEIVLSGFSWSAHYDQKVDSWSVGVMVFFMLCAHHPFDRKDMLVTHVGTGYDRRTVNWTLLQDNASAEAKDVISRLLIRSPRHRMAVSELLGHPWVCRASPDIYLQSVVAQPQPVLQLSSDIQVAGQPLPVVKTP